MEARAEPARAEGLRRAGQRRHRSRARSGKRRLERASRPGFLCKEGKCSADRRRSRSAARRRRGRRVFLGRAQDLRADTRGGAARVVEGFRQVVHGAPWHPDRPPRELRACRGRQGLYRRARRAHRHQGRWPRRRKGRGGGGDTRRGARRDRHDAHRPAPGRRRVACRPRGVPGRRRGELHRDERRRACPDARHQPGPQAPARRRRRAQHRRHGRVFAGARGDAEGPLARDARDHPPRGAGHGEGRRALHRLPVRRPDDRIGRQSEGAAQGRSHRRPAAAGRRLPGVPGRHAARGQERAHPRRARAVRHRARRLGEDGAQPRVRCRRAHPLRRHAIPQGHWVSRSEAELNVDAQAVHDYFANLQSRIVAALEALEGTGFRTDRWQRPEGGGGVTRVIEEGRVFERGGVNLSRVQGSRLPPSATAARPQFAGEAYDAMGVSLVLHPRNPYCPTVHMNVRFFAAASAWWFGGGMDLTPYYGFEDDARHFHAACRDALAPFGADYYPRFKRECDEYFQLRHRGEPRGIGGIFFDDFADRDFDFSFSLTRSVADHFLAAYRPILERRRQMQYGERERDFQAYRRGRYVEFNLVYDRGTLFGLQSGGRAESILMSLPPRAAWRYDWKPEPGSPEEKLYTDFLKPRDWL